VILPPYIKPKVVVGTFVVVLADAGRLVNSARAKKADFVNISAASYSQGNIKVTKNEERIDLFFDGSGVD
jgi:hypothetical protein